MDTPKKMAFVFGDITLTMGPADVEAVYLEYEKRTGKRAHTMSSDEFADNMMKRLKASARPTRTVLHN